MEFCSPASGAEVLVTKAFTKANRKKGKSKRSKSVGR
jgi:hypothetical protein